MPTTLRRLPAIIVFAFALALGACGDGTTPDGSPNGSPTETPTQAPAESPTTVTATMTEYEIALSTTPSAPGTYTFIARQAGQEPHALSIQGPDVTATTETISPGGQDQELTVTLQPGTYKLWCPVGNHEAQGMVLEITIA